MSLLKRPKKAGFFAFGTIFATNIPSRPSGLGWRMRVTRSKAMKGGKGNYEWLPLGVTAPVAIVLLGVGCQTPPASVEAGMLMKHDGVYYHEDDTDTPFSGVAEAFYTNSTPPALLLRAPFRYGRLHGVGIIWHANGIKKQEIEYNKGLQVLRLAWTDTGVPIPIQQVAVIPAPLPVTTNQPPATNVSSVLISQLTRKGDLMYHGNDALPYNRSAVEKFPDGKPKQEENYNFGQRHGASKTWHPNGQLKYEATFANGKLNGTVIWWSQDGKKEYEAKWANAIATRKTTYAPDSTESGRMEDGEGKLVFFHPNGRKRLEETYAAGRLIRAVTWNKAGGKIADLDLSTLNPLVPPPNN